MRDDDDKQSSMRKISQKQACEDGGDNGHSPQDDTTNTEEEEQSNNNTKCSQSLSMDVVHHAYNKTNGSVADLLSCAKEEKLEVHEETEQHNRLNNQPKHDTN